MSPRCLLLSGTCRAKVEEAHLNGACARLVHASADLFAILLARFGSSRQPNNLKPKLQEDKEISKLPKRKLPAPMDGWKNPTCKIWVFLFHLIHWGNGVVNMGFGGNGVVRVVAWGHLSFGEIEGNWGNWRNWVVDEVSCCPSLAASRV